MKPHERIAELKRECREIDQEIAGVDFTLRHVGRQIDDLNSRKQGMLELAKLGHLKRVFASLNHLRDDIYAFRGQSDAHKELGELLVARELARE